MKKIVKFLCGFFITFFTLAFFISILYAYFTSSRFLLDVANRSDYYEKSYTQIITNLEKQVVNEEIKQILPETITKEKVNSDLRRMMISLSSKKNIYAEIENETKMQFQETLTSLFPEEDVDSFNELAKGFTTSYMKDLFPYSEFMKIEGKLVSIHDPIPMSIFFLLMAFLLTLLSFFFNKKRPLELFYRSNFVSGILMIMPFCFCNLFHLFQKFYYSNAYFSLFIRKTFYIMVNLMGMLGVLLLLITLILELYENKKGK